MLADCHLHTEYSDDSSYPMAQAARDALRLGLGEICFTDHVDYGIKEDWDAGRPIPLREGKPLANVDYPRYWAQIHRLQEEYAGRLVIGAGLECGVQTHTIPAFEALCRRYPWDFVLLSIHQVGDKELWTGELQQGKTQDEYNRLYYQELLEVVRRFKGYSVLGHMDLAARYDPAGPWPFEKVRPWAEAILGQVIADGKGIEVNTSARRYGLGQTMPGADLLRLYRQMGGEIVTIGSDSHRPGQLGEGIAPAQALLKELGFGRFCTYHRGEPVFHPL